MNDKKGFSLLEIILVIGIMGVIGAYSSTLLTRTYQSTTKTELTGKLKANGQNALNIITEVIRMSDGVVCYEPDPAVKKKYIIVRDSAGQFTMFRFEDPIMILGLVTQNGYITRQEKISPYVITNYCTNPLPPVSAADVPITDVNLTNLTTGVSISDGEFIKVSGNFNKDTVTIKFNVNPPGTPAGGTFDVVTMQTTVQVR